MKSESKTHFPDFPPNVFYEFSGLSKKGLQKFKKTDKKSGRIFISIGLTQKN